MKSLVSVSTHYTEHCKGRGKRNFSKFLHFSEHWQAVFKPYRNWFLHFLGSCFLELRKINDPLAFELHNLASSKIPERSKHALFTLYFQIDFDTNFQSIVMPKVD